MATAKPRKKGTRKPSKARPAPVTTARAHESGHRSVWQGSLTFGLVQIPVRLVNAERSRELTFHQLDRRDQSRIRYERINERTGKHVEYSDIVKGYELKNGSLVVMEDEDFEKAAVEATHTVDILDFVNRAEILPAYFERPYFVLPDKTGMKPYALIREVLEKLGLVAVGLVVIRTRQHLCAIFPEANGLVLEVLRFEDELVPLKSVAADLPANIKATEKEHALAEQLVETLRGKWDPKKYKDVYRTELLSAIEHKAKTGKLPAPPKSRKTSNVTDLITLLQKSVARAGKGKAA
jgi:DNA end-binding protein Ku